MVVKKNSILYWLMMRVPMWIPLGMEQCRVGDNTTDYFRIFVCHDFRL